MIRPLKTLLVILCCGVSVLAYAANAAIQAKLTALLPRARSGDAVAQMKVGALYALDNDYRQALPCLERAVKQHNANAMATLGSMYEHGWGVARNLPKAIHLYQQSVKGKSAVGANYLGVLYSQGIGVPKNYPKAKHLFEQSARGGFVGGYYNLGIMTFYGQGQAANQPLGLHYFRQAALKGYVDAQNKLGAIYSVGKELHRKQNAIKSYLWYQVATLNGSQKAAKTVIIHKESRFNAVVPYCYSQGKIGVAKLYAQGQAGLPQSTQLAQQWYQAALHLSPHLAAVQLAYARFLLRQGQSLKALPYLQHAASQPYGPAQVALARYFNGFRNWPQMYAYAKLAVYTFSHPATTYYAHYNVACRPDLHPLPQDTARYAQSLVVAAAAHLSQAAQQKAEAKYHTLLAHQLQLKQPLYIGHKRLH